MPEASEAVWIKFFETPLAELEEYGASYRVIFSIEMCCGLYVKNVQGVSFDDLVGLPNCAFTSISKFQNALKLLFEDLKRKESNGPR